MMLWHHGKQSHRTMSRVKSVSSPSLLLAFLIISMGLAAPIIPLAAAVAFSGSAFHVLKASEVGCLC